MNETLTQQGGSKILSTVPPENAFYFCTAEGVYTKISANSLQDFADKLEGIDESSILFHYPRGDFQAWIRDTLKDIELAKKMSFIQQGISGQILRNQLLEIVKTRIKELKEKFPSRICNPEGLCLS
jgi:hypothetical protein